MRNSGGHSGNSFEETHIPLLVIGTDCESNSGKFYNQIDFAPTFSLMNGFPVPSSSIGSIIPELLTNITQLEKLDRFLIVTQHLLKLAHDYSPEECNFRLEKAKAFHMMFASDSNNQNAFLQAEKNYLTLSSDVSDHLARLSMDVNLFHVLLGLLTNLLTAFTLLVPCDALMKDLKISIKSFVPLLIGGVALKLLFFNEVFLQSNDIKSLIVITSMCCLLRVVTAVLHSKLQRIKWARLFDNDLLYLCMIGQIFFVISVGSSSFVEEEHQIWYYICNAIFVFLAFDFRGRSNAKTIFIVTARCVPFLILHIIIRRMNATGDKWINLPDLGDWLHQNNNFMHVYIACSLVASAIWLVRIHCAHNPMMIPFVIIGNILLYFHHTRSINNR